MGLLSWLIKGTWKEKKEEPSTDVICPNCKGKEWFEGPEGGCSINIQCAGCNKRYNYLMPPLNRLDYIGEGKPIES